MIRQATHVIPEKEPFFIADWLVDPRSHTITRGEETNKLEPKAMCVLLFLAGRAGAVVSREELENHVWSNSVVGYDALCNAIIKIRKAFGDRARQPRVIETISKSGYRLIATASSAANGDPHRDALTAGSQAAGSQSAGNQSAGTRSADSSSVGSGSAGNYAEPVYSRPEPEQPRLQSIAVLAFNYLSGDSGQEYFCDGLVEDLITDLSRVSGLFLIARNSSFAYKGGQINLQAVSRELGVRYILEGSVRKQGQTMRITAQLIDGTTGGHVWAERYDREMTGSFELQDIVRREIVDALKRTLSLVSQDRPGPRGTANEEAYHYFLRGREQDRLDTEMSNHKARELFELAIDRDPGFSNAYAYLSRNRAVCHINRWSDDFERLLQSALELGRKAIELDHFNPHAHFATGASLLWMRQHDHSLREAETAIELDPNFAEGHALLGMILVYMGRCPEAIHALHTAMRLDPWFRDTYLHIVAQAYFHSGQYQLAVDALKNRLIRKPDSDTSRVLLAAAYGQLGELEKSRCAWAEALRINPAYSLQDRGRILPYQNTEDYERFAEGLRRAALLEAAD